MRRKMSRKITSFLLCLIIVLATLTIINVVLDTPFKVNASNGWLDAIKLNDFGTNCKEPKVAAEGNNLHVVWVNNDNGKIYYKKSIDNGWTWSNDIELASGSNPRIAIWGNNVHVLWNNGYKKSTDNGSTWSGTYDIFSGFYMTVCYDLAVYGNNVYVAAVERIDSGPPDYEVVWILQFKNSSTKGDSWESWVALDGPTWDAFLEIAIVAKNNYVHIVYGTSPFGHSGGIRWYNHTYSDSEGVSWYPPYFINTEGDHYFGPSLSYYGSSVLMAYSEQLNYKIRWGYISGPNNPIGDGWGYTSLSEDYIVWTPNPESDPTSIESNIDGTLVTIDGHYWNSEFFDVHKENEHVHFVFIDNYQVYYKHKGPWSELFITSSDIQFNPLSPIENGSSVFINATVHNTGVAAQNVEVKFYNGYPDTNNDLIPDPTAVEIGNDTININKDSSALASIQWLPPSVGTYNIYVWVDPNNNTKEYNYSNNLANITLEVIPGIFTFELVEGWNLISIPLELSENNFISLLQPIQGHYDAIQWYNSTDANDHWKHYHISKPSSLNDLHSIDQYKGFWIHITEPGGTTLTIIDNKISTSQSIHFHRGWNLVGYPSLTSYNRTDGLNNVTFGSEVDSIWSYEATTQKWAEMSPSDYFEPGRGYWVHSKVKKVWDVPL